MQYILVPLDGSERAEMALPVAARIARNMGASLMLLYAVQGLSNFAVTYSMNVPAQLVDIDNEERKEASEYLQRIVTSDIFHDLPVEHHIIEENAAEAILSLAQTYQPALIVMCSHGRTGVKRWLLGSVAHKVAWHSETPVLILRPDAHEGTLQNQENNQGARVMVALDGSAFAETALVPAITLAQALSAPAPAAIHLASVVHAAILAHLPITLQEQIIDESHDYLIAAEQMMRQEGQDEQKLSITSSLTLADDIAATLIELAETGDGMEKIEGFTGCDVIAIATHGRSGIAKWAIGSIAERILNATKLPILLVRPKQESKPREVVMKVTSTSPSGGK